jgi:hypothetical protein
MLLSGLAGLGPETRTLLMSARTSHDKNIYSDKAIYKAWLIGIRKEFGMALCGFRHHAKERAYVVGDWSWLMFQTYNLLCDHRPLNFVTSVAIFGSRIRFLP